MNLHVAALGGGVVRYYRGRRRFFSAVTFFTRAAAAQDPNSSELNSKLCEFITTPTVADHPAFKWPCGHGNCNSHSDHGSSKSAVKFQFRHCQCHCLTVIRVKRDPVTIVIHILMFHGGGPASAIKELPDGICSRLINEVLL